MGSRQRRQWSGRSARRCRLHRDHDLQSQIPDGVVDWPERNSDQQRQHGTPEPALRCPEKPGETRELYMKLIVERLAGLVRNRSGVAAVELALGAPLVLTLGLWGAELGNLAITHMRVSQLAMQLADNGSRIGDESMLENLKIYESDINDLL